MFLNKQTRQIISIVIFAGLVLMVLFNIFGSVLDHVIILPVHPLIIIPFILLLSSIALMPFINRYWWAENYTYVSFILGSVVFTYYFFILNNVPRVFLTSYEYISFISLIGSLFIVTGGIHVKIPGKTTPIGNVAILATGAILANILGTTGASMLLIRPFLRVNKYRIQGYHVVFFIFLVSNIGGALSPIGDPPLFLGFLKGIPFFWITSRVGSIWFVAVGLLLVIFYFLDLYFFHKESKSIQHRAAELDEPEVSGLHNIVFLMFIIGAVFIEPPAPLLLRELIMWIAASGSYFTTSKELHKKNDFNFVPIKEVAILFAGIFATMIPALDWLELNAAKLNIVAPEQYYWGSGILSSVLDNAPTYLNFLTAAFGLHGANIDNVHHMNLILDLASPVGSGFPNPLQPHALLIDINSWKYVQAISVGSVFFGAVTYIGNGPNFMVKSIAEQAQVRCPGFVGYIVRYSLPILLPIFILIWLLFFH